MHDRTDETAAPAGKATSRRKGEEMEIRGLHPWDVSTGEARRIQEDLRDRVERRPPEDFDPTTVAGTDLSVGRGRGEAIAAVAVLERATLETVEESAARAEVSFPYVPGLLSFRELPALAAAWEELGGAPDAVLFDGHGLAHPRRFGLACHGGLLLDLPAVGCAKSVLVGEHDPPGRARGSTAELRHEGELVGMAVRIRAGVRPVFVSVGHRMDLATAVELVLSVSPRYRIPEPLRRADSLAGRLRRADAGDD